jgi:hypothetical protein
MTNFRSNNQTIVELQLVILKIGQIDTKNETFYAEFFLEASWFESLENIQANSLIYDPMKHFNPSILICNSFGELKQDVWYKVEQSGDDKVLVSERHKIQGLFWQRFDFANFPVEVQTLNIEISSSKPAHEVLLVESQEKFNCLNPNAFMGTQEWNLYGYIKAKEGSFRNQISVEQYSSYTISISASRIPTYYLYNAYFLILMITIIGLCRFTVTCDIPQVRLIIDTTVTLTLITFKWVFSESLPQTSYLTSLDLYILFAIVFISLQFVYDSVIGLVSGPKCQLPFSNVDRLALIVSASLIIAVNIAFFAWLILFAYKNRRELYKQSKMHNYSNSARLFTIYNNNLKAYETNSGVLATTKTCDLQASIKNVNEATNDASDDISSLFSETIRI